MLPPRVKICGTTSVADALLAAEAGADAIGLIFAPSSKRWVSAQVARAASLAVGPSVGRVGVFLQQPLDEVLRLAEAARLSGVQVHGEAAGVYLLALSRYYPVLRVLRPQDLGGAKATGPGATGLAATPEPIANLTLMVDAAQPGSGKALNWPAVAPHFPPGAWLAGGLGPENVAQALATLRPAGVDAVTHLEARPGVKDPQRVRDFVQAAKNVSRP